jgi:hypothetical protein
MMTLFSTMQGQKSKFATSKSKAWLSGVLFHRAKLLLEMADI